MSEDPEELQKMIKEAEQHLKVCTSGSVMEHRRPVLDEVRFGNLDLKVPFPSVVARDACTGLRGRYCVQPHRCYAWEAVYIASVTRFVTSVCQVVCLVTAARVLVHARARVRAAQGHS